MPAGNVIPNGLEKYMRFNINNKLIFIGSFQFLSSSLDSLAKNVVKNNFNCLSQEFDNKVLDFAKQKGFYPYEYISILRSLRRNFQEKKSFIIL